ncbi:zinc finger and BTB domain-containing protein 22-like isoform X1 [Cyclopterus lumpus]|uniref:zinc finger and BTB domain-containing protein 22-like isoform X1 n=2 Tax=Cyclopterus lumpus TaxID=8103 RepID=UPI001486DBE7|nr:zinc finger and BTB domain-containing protein 22-like isoform X1 [Cyclopterus lumpus]XP_034402010.1 zinc finger and BTB domain-containing protein 22-like isoform X1 [Cyclopterus lumpus]
MDATCSASAAPAGLTVQVCFPGARAAVLDNLNRQREEGRLCDLSIQVQGQVFRAHRCVLAASSPYFHDQVLLKNVTTVSLPSVMDPVAFESVLSSAYTGQLSIVHDDIVNYVTVASFLQMWHIVDKCTEILKRPRPSTEASHGEAAAAHPGTASRQQSPSSTDCLYLEREGRRKERKPDALPPLATWRRPQQFPRWGRPRPSSAQHLADSQLDALAGYAESDYANCEEAWVSSHSKTSHFAQDGPGHNSRYHGGFPSGEALKQKARFQQRGVPPGSDRLLDKNRESGDSDETQEKRRKEKREIEAVVGVREAAAVEKKGGGFAQMGHCDFRPISDESVGQATGKASVEEIKEKVQRSLAGRDPPSVPPSGHGCQTGGGIPGPTCPVSARLQWQTGAWSQQEQGLQDGEGGSCSKDEDEDEEEEEDADFECFTEGTFSRGTYDEIEDGTGQVSQRPLVPASPDFTMAGSEVNWPSAGTGQGSSSTPTSSRHLSPSSAAFPPPSSPPTPSSSSSVSLAGAPYTGKVHFCHCGKAYTLKSMRDRHVKMQHLNLRPFGCPVCTKSFKMKHHLTKHLKTHGGLRPYECGLCGKKVIWRDSFLRHQARCERLASSSSANGNNASAPAADMDDGFSYGFEDGEAFLATGGQVKVEEVDFHREMEEGMRGLLGSVSGIVNELRTQSQNLDADSHVFKEEASESFTGN